VTVADIGDSIYALLLARKTFNIIWLFNFSILSVPDEGYSRNTKFDIYLLLDTLLLKQKKVASIKCNGFVFPHSYSRNCLSVAYHGFHLSTLAEKETHYIQYGPLHFFQ
jgi:hypothetical protein